jgi:hypothetical protein
LEVIISVYLTVSLFAIYMTYREQKQAGTSSLMFRLLGFVACALWPLPLTAMIASKAFDLTSEGR